jgi:hypothetical protein
VPSPEDVEPRDKETPQSLQVASLELIKDFSKYSQIKLVEGIM